MNFKNYLQTVLDALFDPSQIEQDETQIPHSDSKSKLQLGGLGSTGNTKGKYEGFGSTPRDKEGKYTCSHHLPLQHDELILFYCCGYFYIYIYIYIYNGHHPEN